VAVNQAAPPVGPAPAGAQGAAAGPADLLEQRLLATQRWLAQEQGGVFSIQLLGSSDLPMLRAYLATLSNYIETDKIFVYRTVANREPSMTVLYGAFGARAEAVKSLDALPPELKVNRPYIRTVQGIRSELGSKEPS
jgi:septal ring-binding cell division protein DamX